jgi:uncharacterized membrane protein
MTRKRLVQVFGLIVVLSCSVGFAHSGGGVHTIWESQTFAYFVTSVVTAICYIGMVWEPGKKRQKEKGKR